MNEENNKDYEFVTETIKKKPVNKKRMITKVLQSTCLGILAGLVACVVFAVFAPKMYQKIHPDKPELVSIPEDIQEEYVENPEIEEVTSAAPVDDAEVEKLEIEVAESDDKSAENTDGDESENKETTDSKDDKSSEVAESDDAVELKTAEDTDDETESNEEASEAAPSTVIIQKEKVTLDDYKEFYRELGGVANVAKRSLTMVRGVTDSTDWFKNSYESGNVSTGLIVADNGKELLIITNSNRLERATDIEVTFCDGRSYAGTIKKSDSNTGLVVVAVVLDDIEEATKNSYATAILGNSMVPTIVGSPVIAIGSPLGIEESMAVGTVTSNTRVLEHTDNNIRYLTTDIYGSTEGSGVLINLEGRVIGIIFQGGISTDTKNLVHAYSISDIKSIIEKLSNGQDTAYLGIIGTDVTQKANETLSVPMGAYVKQVVVDSPAMKGGIQNGDVIVKLGTTNINSFKDYKDAIYKCQPGDTAMVTVKRLGKDGYVEFSYEIYLEALK